MSRVPPAGRLLLIVLAALVSPFAGAALVTLGLADTWLDFRGRLASRLREAVHEHRSDSPEDVEHLGKAGALVKVKPGYARNFLLPRGLAYEATDGNKKRILPNRRPGRTAWPSRRSMPRHSRPD